MNVSPSAAAPGRDHLPHGPGLRGGALGFDGVCLNSMDGVSDRDFCVEFLSALSILMMHLSRFSEEIILWSSWEFQFVELSDAYTTGSSIMPQKKNPDMAELVRGKTGRVYGDLMALLTTLKGLPLAYNKDMQEDKEGVFDGCDTVKLCLTVFAAMIATMSRSPKTCAGGPERLHQRHGPCRLSGAQGPALPQRLQDLRPDRRQVHPKGVDPWRPCPSPPIRSSARPVFGESLRGRPGQCVEKRQSEGGTSAASVDDKSPP